MPRHILLNVSIAITLRVRKLPTPYNGLVWRKLQILKLKIDSQNSFIENAAIMYRLLDSGRDKMEDVSDRIQGVVAGLIIVLQSELQGLEMAISKLKGKPIRWKQDMPVSGELIGEFEVYGQKYALCFTQNNQGQHVIPPAIETLLRNFPSIDFLALIGCSGGFKDVSVGDIIVPNDVDHFDVRVAEDTHGQRFSGAHYNTNLNVYHEVQRFKYVHKELFEEWQICCREQHEQMFCYENSVPTSSPTLHTGLIVSGNSVVKAKEYIEKLHNERSRHVLAVDTESSNFCFAMRKFPTIRFVVVRGLSDLATAESKGKDSEHKTTPYKNPYQVLAVFNASAFLFTLLNHTNLVRHVAAKGLVDRFFELQRQDREIKLLERAHNDNILKLLDDIEPDPKKFLMIKGSGNNILYRVPKEEALDASDAQIRNAMFENNEWKQAWDSAKSFVEAYKEGFEVKETKVRLAVRVPSLPRFKKKPKLMHHDAAQPDTQQSSDSEEESVERL